MTHYAAGRRFEWRVRDDLLDTRGFHLVIRSAGSKSPYDLIALDTYCIWLVQCKANIGCKAAQHLADKLTRANGCTVAACLVAHVDGKEVCYH